MIAYCKRHGNVDHFEPRSRERRGECKSCVRERVERQRLNGGRDKYNTHAYRVEREKRRKEKAEKVETFQYLLHGNPLPDHAEVVSTFERAPHHRRYSVLIQLHAKDTGYEGVDLMPRYGFSLPDPLPQKFRSVYIEALDEPGLRRQPQSARAEAA